MRLIDQGYNVRSKKYPRDTESDRLRVILSDVILPPNLTKKVDEKDGKSISRRIGGHERFLGIALKIKHKRKVTDFYGAKFIYFRASFER